MTTNFVSLQYIHGNSTRLPIPALTDENDHVLERDAEKATGFNLFFVHQTFLREDGHPVDISSILTNTDTLSSFTTTPVDVLGVLQSLPKRKAPGKMELQLTYFVSARLVLLQSVCSTEVLLTGTFRPHGRKRSWCQCIKKEIDHS